MDLPKGATPVDFARTLHTYLGHRTRGAKVRHWFKTQNLDDSITGSHSPVERFYFSRNPRDD